MWLLYERKLEQNAYAFSDVWVHVCMRCFYIHSRANITVWLIQYLLLFLSSIIVSHYSWKKNSSIRPCATIWSRNGSYWIWMRASWVAQWYRFQQPMKKAWVQSLGWEAPLEKEMATHSSILAWEIPWTEEPDRLPSIGSQKSWTWLSN